MNNKENITPTGAQSVTAQGKKFWRSLDELAGTDEFNNWLHREFPSQASEWLDSLSRRKFLKVMGASLAFAGLTSCIEMSTEKIVPYVQAPEEIVPGKPLFYASTITLAGAATGILVESHMGRPTKIEGNPEHPGSLGGSDLFSQASVLDLYDPDRAASVTYLGETRTWGGFLGALRSALEQEKQNGNGAGLRILTETVISPTLAKQLKDVLTFYPAAKWHQYEPANADMVRAGAKLSFGEYVNTVYDLKKADIILSIDNDFLACWPGTLRYARDYSTRRRIGEGNTMSRLYVIESMATNTGGVADHRMPVKPSEVEGLARAIAAAVGVEGVSGGNAGKYGEAVNALAKELKEHKGACVVMAGDYQPPIVHALAHAMNQALGNVGNTVTYTESLEPNPVDQNESLKELVKDMEAGKVSTLVILGGNPVYNAPVELNFKANLDKVKFRAHISSHFDETSERCLWHVPQNHYLETWSDARSHDGTLSIVQPLIYPLYAGKSLHEVVACFNPQTEKNGYDIIKDAWRAQYTGTDFESDWRKALHDGYVANSALKAKTVSLKTGLFATATAAEGSGMEILFRPDPTVFDGRFANNGWLQELPKPISRLTWDNAVMMSPETAKKLGVGKEFATTGGEHGQAYADMVELSYQGRKIKAAAWIMPGQVDDVLTFHLGYGRKRSGRIGTGNGFNAYEIRTADQPWQGKGAQVTKLAETFQIACVQGHNVMEGRDIVRTGTVEEFKKNPTLKPEEGHGEENPEASKGAEGESEHGAVGGKKSRRLTMYKEHEYPGYAWGMAIDLNSCVGCSACVVACQSENNSPVVGKEQVMAGREMHWIRIDRYFKSEGHEHNPTENPETYFHPVPCQQCEEAPCEVVCPATATAHSSEGLNDMIYNRCVGTRYCSNNCPYKVRRFNYLQFADFETPSLKLLRNPDVTVRSRGVMEKCTYCVQRINYAKIEAEKENRKVADGEILTACQSVCPTEAIVFGDINDTNSRVSKLKAEGRNYGLLDDHINTKPRTSYLGALRNPNGEIKKV